MPSPATIDDIVAALNLIVEKLGTLNADLEKLDTELQNLEKLDNVIKELSHVHEQLKCYCDMGNCDPRFIKKIRSI